jgi:hypothetical protein
VKSFPYLLQIDNKQKQTVSERGMIEILKFMIGKFPQSECISLIKLAELSPEARVELAKWYGEQFPNLFFESIDDFDILDEAGLIEVCKSILTKDPTLVMFELPELDIYDQKGLLEILWSAAEFRPDLVLKSINKMKISDQNEKDHVILKCIGKIPSAALNSKKTCAWIDQHQEFIFSNDPALETIIKASKVNPSRPMEEIFDFFNEMAEPSNRPIELAGRCLWFNYTTYRYVKENDEAYEEKRHVYKKLINAKELKKLATFNQCSMTGLALKYAIFGEDSCYEVNLKKRSYRKEGLDKVWATIKKNEESFEEHSKSYFFGYFFQCCSIDHCFFIIQYRDVQNQIKYKLLQSWVDSHSLDDYMKKRKHDLCSEEFEQFAQGLNHVLFTEQCSLQKKIFFKNYFMTEATRSHYSQMSEMSIEWNYSNRSIIAENLEAFDKVKQSFWNKTNKPNKSP